ncbi:MAG TPA: histidinol dehydrogenase, partial [Acidimicrobiales bacterium]
MLRRLDLRGSGIADLRSRLPRPAIQVEPPVDEVRVDDLRVPSADVRAALDRVPAGLRAALEAAHANISAYHAAQLRPELVHRNGAIEIRELVRPVDRAGCYVPSA